MFPGRTAPGTRFPVLGAANPPVSVLAHASPQTDIFTVDSTSDYWDIDPGNGICAAANGRCTLRAAIMQPEAGTGARAILQVRRAFEGDTTASVAAAIRAIGHSCGQIVPIVPPWSEPNMR